jgi:hypothetical protein
VSLKAMTWVLDDSPATGGARLVLLALAEHAHDDGAESYPAVETLARRARMSRRGVQQALRKLEGDGAIAPDGLGPRGQTKWRVVMGGAQTAPRADERVGGRSLEHVGGAPRAPEPTTEPTTNRPTHSTARADEWPEGIKNQAAADAIFVVIDGVAREHGAKVVTKRALGYAMLSAPGRDFIGEAHRMASYYVGRPCRDVVATYRNWLGRAEERHPAVAAAAPNGVQIALLHGGRRDREGERQQRQARRLQAARDEGLIS